MLKIVRHLSFAGRLERMWYEAKGSWQKAEKVYFNLLTENFFRHCQFASIVLHISFNFFWKSKEVLKLLVDLVLP